MGKPTLKVPKTVKEIKAEDLKKKINAYRVTRAKIDKVSLESLNEKLDLIIDLITKDEM
ncbi:hypothetical protein H1S01_13390 [Heliobacterium chlorum]|uniref:Uncharacterized protein n=1 Tax=Heliobacterium chlorum TaxID=2698 RepID=A0ABR7T7F3_HELCL|nr:hypothetical protein [Heliobacterium chlorum]MBC9785496.1 hypothetical protein [Heliobacterium chlorum]